MKRILSAGAGAGLFAALALWPALAAAGTKYSEDWRYVPGDPYSGRPSMNCRVVTIKKYNFFGSKRRAREECFPARRPRPVDPAWDRRDRYDRDDGSDEY